MKTVQEWRRLTGTEEPGGVVIQSSEVPQLRLEGQARAGRVVFSLEGWSCEPR